MFSKTTISCLIAVVAMLTFGASPSFAVPNSDDTNVSRRSATGSTHSSRKYTNTRLNLNTHHNKTRVSMKHRRGLGGRPAKWCGWWMRTQLGGSAEYNRAAAWAKRGSSAGGPQVGAVVVWPHHVGIITGRASNGKWIVKSGNDGGAVRERARSVSGAIAFRNVG